MFVLNYNPCRVACRVAYRVAVLPVLALVSTALWLGPVQAETTSRATDECLYWDRDAKENSGAYQHGIIYEDNYGMGIPVGIADFSESPARAEERSANNNGRPLSATIGADCVFDGKKYYRPDNLEVALGSKARFDSDLPSVSIPGSSRAQKRDLGTTVNRQLSRRRSLTHEFARNPVTEKVSYKGASTPLSSAMVATADTITSGGSSRNTTEDDKFKRHPVDAPPMGVTPRALRATMLSNRYSSLLEGVHRTPILIDPRDMENSVPNLIHWDWKEDLANPGDGGGSSNPNEKRRPTIGGVLGYETIRELPKANSIGVDDEFLKTSMAVYQPLRRMEKDAAEDENARNDYLDRAMSLRGVTVMAMAFLDKTLGSGLVALDQQVKMSTANQQLKQINWAMGKLANPERARAYSDTDEKLEACLEYSIGDLHEDDLKKGAAVKRVDGETTRKRVWYDCPLECGRPPSDKRNHKYLGKTTATEPARLAAGNGSYAYCVCCAEASDTLNQFAEDKEREPAELEDEVELGDLNRASGDTTTKRSRQLFSIVERLFFGVGGEMNPLSEHEGAKKAMNDALRMFKRIYGDVVLTSQKGESGKNNFHYTYQMPAWSPHMLTALYKNRCYQNDPETDGSDLSQIGSCYGDDEDTAIFGIAYGICPSLAWILEKWKEILTPVNTSSEQQHFLIGELAQRWAEASLGHELNGREIKEFLSLNGSEKQEIKEGSLGGITGSVIEAYCDSSSVAAAARMHSRFKAHIADLLLVSQTLTDGEKSQIVRMVDRYTTYLALAENDTAARYYTEALLMGIGMTYDRDKVTSVVGWQQGAMSFASNAGVSGYNSNLLGSSAVGPGSSGNNNSGTPGPTSTTSPVPDPGPFVSDPSVPFDPSTPLSRTRGHGNSSINTIRSVSEVFGRDAGKVIARAELYRQKNDPIRTLMRRIGAE